MSPEGEPKHAAEPSPDGGDAPFLDDDSVATSRPAPASKASRYLATLVDAFGPLPAMELAADVPFVDTLVLDASALAALGRGNVRARAHVARAVGSLTRIVVPATALRDRAHQRIAESLADVVAVDPVEARLAATLLADAPGADPYDAITVAAATHTDRAAIVTMEKDALERLVDAAGRPQLYVFSI